MAATGLNAVLAVRWWSDRHKRTVPRAAWRKTVAVGPQGRFTACSCVRVYPACAVTAPEGRSAVRRAAVRHRDTHPRERPMLLLATVNFPFVATQNCTHGGLAGGCAAVHCVGRPTAVERRIDAQMGDQDVVEALFGAGRFQGGVVETLWGQSSDDLQLDRVRAVGSGCVLWRVKLRASSARGAQAGPVQGDHQRAP